MKFKHIVIIPLLALVMTYCQKDDEEIDVDQPYDPAKDEIVKPGNEIRAAWVATVSNLDWPTTKGDPTAQKSELITILDHCKSLNFNAVILQVRPTADAFYPSALEPWSSYLTGTQGTDPGYDPLQFAVDEAHKRGMELHAWLNPYRIGATSITLASSHVALKNPDWMVTFNNVRYFNPGVPEAIEHLKNVIKDIVTRYDVDAIHFDDYFYPDEAKSASNPFGFDDKAAWEKYGQGKDIHTWRAGNVSRMVSEVRQVIRSVKPGVLFGISPSGRRENSLNLYADPLEWLDNKWIDYLAPQMYWEFGNAIADFGLLATYWNNNARGIPMIIGIAAYKFKNSTYPAYGSTAQIGSQIACVRANQNLNGCFFFRVKFIESGELFNFLKTKYPYPSVLPFMGTATIPVPGAPVILQNGNTIKWDNVVNAVKYGVYSLEKDPEIAHTFNANLVQLSSDTQFNAEKGKSYFVTAINKENAESDKSAVLTLYK
jgi:uncharacterized lipoprotein YddW (UPF0748 family)